MFYLLHLRDNLSMAKQFKIVVMFIALGIFLVPTSVIAHIDYSHQSEKNCCSNNTGNSQSDCCKNHKKQEDGNKDCNGTCGNLACHCPSSTPLPINYSSTAEEINSVAFADFKIFWNYAKQQPKPVYFQIWSPPKLS